MLNKILTYTGKITLLVILIGATILTCYGIVALGILLLKWAESVV